MPHEHQQRVLDDGRSTELVVEAQILDAPYQITRQIHTYRLETNVFCHAYPYQNGDSAIEATPPLFLNTQ
jgi:hypothetical protein